MNCEAIRSGSHDGRPIFTDKAYIDAGGVLKRNGWAAWFEGGPLSWGCKREYAIANLIYEYENEPQSQA